MQLARLLRPAAAVVVAVAASLALAGDTAVKVKGVGAASIRWNTVGYRAELMAQLAPGLTWRLGANGATRMEIEKMGLSAPGGLLLPGEMTLNLRYWSDTRWELVVFEENDWKWSEDKTEFGRFEADVVQRKEAKDATDQLELELYQVARAKLEPLPRPAVTGDAGVEDYSPPWEMSSAAAKERDAFPLVVLDMKFGPHIGRCVFEPVRLEKHKAKLTIGETEYAAELHGAEFTDVLSRTEKAEHEESLQIGLLRLAAKGEEPRELVLEAHGGEDVVLWPIDRKEGEELEPVFGERVDTKGKAKRVTHELDGSTLVVHLAGLDYRFDLSALEL